MKLTEKDKQDACSYIMDQSCKTYYGDDYEKKDIHFSIDRIPVTVRQIVDLFIEWLKIKIENERIAKKDIVQTEDIQKP